MSDTKSTIAASVGFTTLEVTFKAVVVVPSKELALNEVGRAFQDAFETATDAAHDTQNFCLGYSATTVAIAAEVARA